MNQRKAIYFALFAVLLWSTVATAFKVALQYLTPLELLTVAAVTSVIFFAMVLTVNKSWVETMAIGRRRSGFYALQGLVNPAAYYWVLFAAYDQLPAQQAQAINYTWAITMSLLAVPFLGHTLSRKDLLAMVLAYAGVFLIATGGQWDLTQTNWSGIGLAVLSTLLWATYWLLNTKNQDPPIPALFWCFVWGILWLALVNGLSSLLGAEPNNAFTLTWPGLVAGVYVGLFEMGVTFVLWLTAMRLATKTAQISTLIFLSPFISLVLIYVVLDEMIQITTFVGLLLICIGLYQQRDN